MAFEALLEQPDQKPRRWRKVMISVSLALHAVALGFGLVKSVWTVAEMPLPAIAEVQRALFDATTTITGEDEDSVKRRLRTGTVVTTDDRNWELRYAASALRFNQSRAVAIDMESATVAAQGYRFRVPYGTLLCVSDKPLHGELKLPGQANAFYERAISQHLRIGIEALNLLQREGEGLHSRKLRSFDEPPLR